MSAYAARLAEHLAKYKHLTLGVAEDGLWRRNKRFYPHILPAELGNLNVLPAIREAFEAYVSERGIKKHSDFHHLSSSQAFAFNVFFPFRLALEAAGPLTQALGVPGDSAKSIELEVVLDPAEGSNLDVVVTCGSGQVLVIEVKLCEGGFGACRADEPHRAKRRDIYTARLAGKVIPAALSDEVFFTHYQLLRNISYADARAHRSTVFFVPYANSSLRTATEAFLDGFLVPEYRQWVRIVYAESLLTQLIAKVKGPDWLVKQLSDTASKYLLTPVFN